MANPEHVEIVKQGPAAIAVWNAAQTTRLLGKREALDLRGAELFKSDFRRVDLQFAQFDGANLSESNFYQATLIGADLTDADLSRSRLFETNLENAALTRANLRSANIMGANFGNTVLDETDFTDSEIWAAYFNDCDFSTARGLESVRHKGPSSIGIDTLIYSRGAIPEAFLRGAGVPEMLIRYLPSLLADTAPIQFYSCFISYSHKDEEFCKRLRSRMRDEKMRVWYAPEDMPGGKKLHEEIDHAIRVHDKLLLVLSEQSMKSEWVGTEIRKARKRELNEKKKVLFPIRLVPFAAIRDWELFSADEGRDLATEIREYYIPDFSNWKDHDAFEVEFGKLLRDMKAAAE